MQRLLSAFLSLSLRNHQDSPISAWAGLSVLTASFITSSHVRNGHTKGEALCADSSQGCPQVCIHAEW